MSICCYDVEYAYCGLNRAYQFNHIEEAAKHILAALEKDRDIIGDLYLYETEYANERMAKLRFPIDKTPLWSCYFHEETDLLVLAGQSLEEGSRLTRNGKVMSMAEYAKMLTERDACKAKQICAER